MTRSVMITPARLGLIFGLTAAPLLAAPASAEEGMFFKDMLGSMGVIPKSKAPIAYRDRAPLVVPPKTTLPPPGSRMSAAANPGWPNDPDVAARRRAAEEDSLPVTWGEKRRSSGENNLRLTPAEIQAGRVASSSAPVPGTHRGDSARDVILLSPDALRAKPREAQPDDGPEPGRRALTDPPSGMRKWAGGKAIKGDFAPRGVDTMREESDPMAWITGRFKKNDDD